MTDDKAGKITNDTKVTATELAIVLGLTVRRVQQMAQDGTLTLVQRGKFLLGEAVRQYINFLDKGMMSWKKKS